MKNPSERARKFANWQMNGWRSARLAACVGELYQVATYSKFGAWKIQRYWWQLTLALDRFKLICCLWFVKEKAVDVDIICSVFLGPHILRDNNMNNSFSTLGTQSPLTGERAVLLAYLTRNMVRYQHLQLQGTCSWRYPILQFLYAWMFVCIMYASNVLDVMQWNVMSCNHACRFMFFSNLPGPELPPPEKWV